MSGFTARRIGEPVGAILLENAESGARVMVLASLGATLWTLRLPVQADRDGRRGHAGSAAEILEGDHGVEELQENPGFRGRILTPFNDRIPQGRYRFNGASYELPANDPTDGSAIHGLVYKRVFDVCELSADFRSAEVKLQTVVGDDEYAGYPFAIRVSVAYRLDAFGLRTTIAVKNESSSPAPVSMGMHPYFLLDSAVGDTTLYCPGDAYVEVDGQLLPTGAHVPIQGSCFDYTAPSALSTPLDIAIRREHSPSALTVIDRCNDRLVVEQNNAPFGYTQLFVPDSATSLAVEPVSAATNAFNMPELGLSVLAPGAMLSGAMRFSRISRSVSIEGR